jgi:hypothetical protein
MHSSVLFALFALIFALTTHGEQLPGTSHILQSHALFSTNDSKTMRQQILAHALETLRSITEPPSSPELERQRAEAYASLEKLKAVLASMPQKQKENTRLYVICASGILGCLAFGAYIFKRKCVTRRNRRASRTRQPVFSRYLNSMPLCWELLGFLMSGKVRTELFEPSIEELKADWLRAKAKFDAPRFRYWITFCFTFRTLMLVVNCWLAAGGDRLARILIEPILNLIRRT